VSIFLTETDTRHSLLHKTKLFRDKIQTRLTSNSSKLMGASQDEPIDLDEAYPQGQGAAAAPDLPILREDDDDDGATNLADIPMADDAETPARPESTNRRPKRRRDPRGHGHGAGRASEAEGAHVEVIDSDSSGNELFVDDDEGGSGSEGSEGEDDSEDDDAGTRQPPSKRRKETAADAAPERDDKKKMALDISYEGFAIYGRVLCLVVKRRGDGGGGARSGGTSAVPSGSNKSQTAAGRPGGQAMLENWIASTQLPDTAAEDAEME